MSDREIRDYEALNADTSLRLNIAQQRIQELEAELKKARIQLDGAITLGSKTQATIEAIRSLPRYVRLVDVEQKEVMIKADELQAHWRMKMGDLLRNSTVTCRVQEL